MYFWQGPHRQFEVGGAWDFFSARYGLRFFKNHSFQKLVMEFLINPPILNCQRAWICSATIEHFNICCTLREQTIFFSFHDDLGPKSLHVWYVTTKGIANVPANISSTKMLGGLQPPYPSHQRGPCYNMSSTLPKPWNIDNVKKSQFS